MNAIVRPDVYERDRLAIRGEPFLWIIGKLAKDDGTVNIIAEEVRPLKLHHPHLKMTSSSSSPSPSSFLKNLRRSAPGSRDWG
jgi:hypothetical protein